MKTDAMRLSRPMDLTLSFKRPRGAGGVTFVASADATVPVSLEVFGSSDTLTIPRPDGVVEGDLMIAAVGMGVSGAITVTAPAGWAAWYNPATNQAPHAGLYYKVAEADEPDDYTWTLSVAAQPCTGSILAFRNAELGALAYQYEPTDPPGDLPGLTAPDAAGAALFAALFAIPGSDGTTEAVTANAPLTLAEVHVANAIANLMSSGTAYELGLGAGEMASGRHMDSNQTNQVDTALFTAIIRAADGPAPVLPMVVGQEKATVPATTGSDAGADVTVPVPAGVAAGDHLFTVVGIPVTPEITPPDGWTLIIHSGTHHVYYREAEAGEPADYTWTVDTADVPRTGCMVAVRGGQVVLGASSTTLPVAIIGESGISGMAVANNGTGAMTIPTLTCRSTGSMLLTFVQRAETGGDEDFTVTGGSTLLVQHVGGGGGTFQSSAIAVEENIAIATALSGRAFVDAEAAGNRRTSAVLIQPV